jgi:hypothetical protein
MGKGKIPNEAKKPPYFSFFPSFFIFPLGS